MHLNYYKKIINYYNYYGHVYYEDFTFQRCQPGKLAKHTNQGHTVAEGGVIQLN